jgi:hypothetical protein
MLFQRSMFSMTLRSGSSAVDLIRLGGELLGRERVEKNDAGYSTDGVGEPTKVHPTLFHLRVMRTCCGYGLGANAGHLAWR